MHTSGLHDRLAHFFASRYFLYIFIGVFIIGCSSIAITSAYPMAFDEEWHMGLIELYSRYLLPYGIPKAPELAMLGSATADPSYLFHYLLSFPYRLLVTLGVSFDVIVVVFRLLNLACLVAALFVYRKVLRLFGLSAAKTHIVLALFTLIPVVVLLGAQVNYDNVLVLITALSVLYTTKISIALSQKTPVSAKDVWLLIITLLIGSATKYAFLPIILAIGIWLIALLIIHRKQRIVRSLLQGTRKLPRLTLAFLAVGFALAVFFNLRYVANQVHYGSPIPSCDTVFDAVSCNAYGPWARDRMLAETRSTEFQPVSYPYYLASEWIQGMTTRLFFAVSGPGNDYQTKEPLPYPIVIFSVVVALSSVAALVFGRKILKQYPVYIVVILMTLIYLFSLSYKVYGTYAATGEPVAINGRYLIPLIPLLGALLVTGLSSLYDRWKNLRPGCIYAAAITLVALVLTGGGSATYFILSESSWFWQMGVPITDSLRMFFSAITLR